VLKREFQISTLAVVVLVLLRIGIGWHFLHEGVWKADQPDFSAEPYLRQAKGPLANWYRDLIPDVYGERRLDVEQMRTYWAKRIDAAEAHFGYSTNQRKAAERALDARWKELDDFLREEAKDPNGEPVKQDGKPVRQDKVAIAKHKRELAAWKENDANPRTREIPHEQKRHWDKLVELQQEAVPWLTEADRLDADFRSDLVRIASAEQLEAAGELPRESYWLDWLEIATTYSLIGIGLCLMLGFATRLAAVVGAVFLLTAVILPQLVFGPSYPPPPPSAGHTFLVNKEVIEMLALLVIALTPAGRWGGLDYIGHGLFGRYYEAVGDFIKRYVGKAVEAVIRLLLRILRRRKSDEPAT
jgi:uncharacterized membrane protein YphA (DoxX/SURF4 family)